MNQDDRSGRRHVRSMLLTAAVAATLAVAFAVAAERSTGALSPSFTDPSASAMASGAASGDKISGVGAAPSVSDVRADVVATARPVTDASDRLTTPTTGVTTQSPSSEQSRGSRTGTRQTTTAVGDGPGLDQHRPRSGAAPTPTTAAPTPPPSAQTSHRELFLLAAWIGGSLLALLLGQRRQQRRSAGARAGRMFGPDTQQLTGSPRNVDPRLEDAEWLRRRYVDHGRSQWEIAEEVGCSLAVLTAAMARHDISQRPPSLSTNRFLAGREWLAARVEAGWSVHAIADSANTSPHAVTRALRWHGLGAG